MRVCDFIIFEIPILTIEIIYVVDHTVKIAILMLTVLSTNLYYITKIINTDINRVGQYQVKHTMHAHSTTIDMKFHYTNFLQL